MKVRYQGYRMNEERTFELEPYFIREFKRRWYLYSHKDNDKDYKPHMYALDRMLEVEILPDTFKIPEAWMPKPGSSLCTACASTTT